MMGPFSPPFGDAKSHTQRSQQYAFYMVVAAIANFVFLASLLKGRISKMFPDRTLVIGIAAIVLLGLCLGVYHVMSTALQSVSYESMVGNMDMNSGMSQALMQESERANRLDREVTTQAARIDARNRLLSNI